MAPFRPSAPSNLLVSERARAWVGVAGVALSIGIAILGMTLGQWLLVPFAILLGVGVLFAKLRMDQYAADLELAEQQGHRMQQQLEEQRRAIDKLGEGLEIAIFVTDAKAAILYANRRAREMFANESPIGRNVLAVTLSYDLEQLVIQAGREGQPVTAELVFSYPGERVGQAKAWPAQDTSGRVFLSVYEITDLRRLERVRRDFVANVSHELRTPMTVIRAMAETLLDDTPPDNELQNRYLNKIVQEVDRLSSISEDLLVLSVAESNPVRKQACDLADIVRSVAGQLRPRAQARGLELVYEGPETLPVQANALQMTQVTMNLLDNAINYTPSGSVTARLGREGDEVVLEIQDTGIGIPVEQQSRVFERFYRVDKARSKATGGTGLGLSIVKHIVEAHGGKVTLQSAQNEGSTFTVRIPDGESE